MIYAAVFAVCAGVSVALMAYEAIRYLREDSTSK